MTVIQIITARTLTFISEGLKGHPRAVGKPLWRPVKPEPLASTMPKCIFRERNILRLLT